MSELDEFIAAIENKTRKSDALILLSLLEKVTHYKPYLSGSIISYGRYHYKYDSGHEGDCAVISFSPRKQNIVVYIMPGFDQFEYLLKQLGKHKLGKCCLYINKLADIDLKVLEKIAILSVKSMQEKYICSQV